MHSVAMDGWRKGCHYWTYMDIHNPYMDLKGEEERGVKQCRAHIRVCKIRRNAKQSKSKAEDNYFPK
jgi:hypothetical protein